MSKQLSKATSEQSINIAVEIMPTGHKRRMFFNRFQLVRIEGQVLAYFGLVDEIHGLRDIYACVLSKETVQNSKDSLTSFLARIGPPTSTAKPWVAPGGIYETDMPNVISVGQSLDAELLLSAFAVGPAINRTKKNVEPIPTDSVALLRCDPEVIKLFIAELYV